MEIYLLSNLLSYKKSIFEKVSTFLKNMIKNIDDSPKRKSPENQKWKTMDPL